MNWPTDYLNQVIQGDCLEVMRGIPDKSVDLVLTDPPYGIGMANNPFRQSFEKQGWDNDVPDDIYFDEIERVSINQIVWGGNYFGYLWKKPSKGILVWDRHNHFDNKSDVELAWTTIDTPAKKFDYLWDGNRYGFPDQKINGVGEPSIRVHPTQKPIELMTWCIDRFAPKDAIILDPFFGSGTTGVAAKLLGLQFIGIEISEKYCEIARKRIDATLVNKKLEFK